MLGPQYYHAHTDSTVLASQKYYTSIVKLQQIAAQMGLWGADRDVALTILLDHLSQLWRQIVLEYQARCPNAFKDSG